MPPRKRRAPVTPNQKPILNVVRHIACPSCHSPNAVMAATHLDDLLCFCPACGHTWDCPNPKP